MHSELVIVPVVFGTFLAIIYFYLTMRNRERMALIEKGAEANIFFKDKNKAGQSWKILIINLALLLMGVGLGVFMAYILESNGMDDEVAYPATIFFMAGVGLLSGFLLTKKLLVENDK